MNKLAKRLSLILAVVFSMALPLTFCGCSNDGTTDPDADAGTSAGIISSSEDSSNGSWGSSSGASSDDSVPDPFWKQPYVELITRNFKNEYDLYFSLYDISGDGIPEIFAERGESEADYLFEVYELKNDTPKKIGEIPAGFGMLCPSSKPNTLIFQEAHQGVEIIREYTYNDGSLSEKELYNSGSTRTRNYMNLDYLPAIALTDATEMSWDANPQTENDAIIAEKTE